MEKVMQNWEQHNLMINELAQGKKLAQQLRSHLKDSSSSSLSSSRETRELLLEKILGCYEKSLSMLNSRNACKRGFSVDGTSRCGSPKNDEAGHMNQQGQGGGACLRDHAAFKKRKTTHKWREQVRVCADSGVEIHPEDGYSWRKYGQKEILGAQFPRAYYRCTHRHSQGCLAIKHVQRSDQDPTVFEVTYRGRHTCVHPNPSSSSSIKKDSPPPPDTIKPLTQRQSKPSLDTLLSFKFDFAPSSLSVKTETPWDVNANDDDHVFPRFSFPSLPTESQDQGKAPNFFADVLMQCNNFVDGLPSPATSSSNCLGLPQEVMTDFSIPRNVQPSEQSDLTEIISAPTSVNNSPIGGATFSLDEVGLDLDFSFDDPDFFS